MTVANGHTPGKQAIVIGGSVAGLATALALADAGHQVQILERDAQEAPATIDAAAARQRATVPQAVHSHAFASLACNLLRKRAADVYEALLEAGGKEINLVDYPPPALIPVRRRPGDDDLRMVTVRRSTFELVLLRRVLARPGVELVRGATVRGLLRAEDDPRRVTGVRLADGTERRADIVVDATGRRSALSSWLADAGLPEPRIESENCRIVYYTRHYKLLAKRPPGPLNRGFGAGGLWDSYTAVLFLGDNDTFSISLGVLPEDAALKDVRHPEPFTAAVRATPMLAGWVAPGNSEPISGVYAMGGLDNMLRLPPSQERPVTGLFAVGDAVCTTNPSYGRGVSLALAHAFLLADLLTAHPVVDDAQASEYLHRTELLMRPWLEEAKANDRGRAGLWQATLEGRPPQRPPAGLVTFGLAVAAASQDEEVWRRVANVMMMLQPPSTLYADDDVRARIGKVMAGGPPPQLPGASRAELVAAVEAAVSAVPS
ncbi:FAD-dependent oxidoreductase [Actinoplanes sp. NPDC051411]|uniref:FAD-dependent oxidoreductase n=1 Tax=Actinoplanes sp. NPDC051411 TaxID=3155522 RepID=UPI0034357C9D